MLRKNNINNKWVYLIGGIAVLSVVFLIYKRVTKKSNSVESKPNFKEGNTTFNKGNLIISIPVTKAKSYSIVYVFGGIDYATPEWMLKQVPQYILSRNVVVLAPYTIGFDSINIKDFLNQKNIKVDENNVSITGFSAGGINVQNKYNKNFKFVGLIDPSTRESFLNLPFGKNTKMVYNDANWTGYPSIRALLPKLDKEIIKKGGESEKVNLPHNKIPKYFFEKYKKELS